MPRNSRRTKHEIAWPDKRKWEAAFAARLQEDERAIAAYRRLRREGCLRNNLLSYLYAYPVGFVPVMKDKSSTRDRALDGLERISGRLDRAATAMQKTLDTKWRSQPTFAAFLEQCSVKFHAVSETGEVIRVKRALNFALHLPSTLRSYSTSLMRLRKELQKQLNVRRVGKSIYLAELACYIEAVTQRPVSWDELADFLNAASPEKSVDKPVDGNLLQKNFHGFARRNKELYRGTLTAVAEYLAACAHLPEKKRPTLLRWSWNRITAKRQPS
jgi:hypothetical protein